MLSRTGLPDERQADPRRWVVLGVMCLSLLLIVMDNTIVNVALPTLQSDLGAGTSQLQWIVDAYILVFAGLLLTMGALGDRFGRRGALAIGLSVMGSGVDAVVVRQQCRPAHRHPGAHGRRRGDDHAGHAVDHHQRVHRPEGTGPGHRHLGGDGRRRRGHRPGHRRLAARALLVGVGLPGERAGRGRRARCSASCSCPPPAIPRAPPVDVPGAVLSIAGLVTLVWAIIEGPGGWTDPEVLGGFALAAVLLGAFILWERRTRFPMLDMNFFRNARFSAASGAIMLTFFAMFGSMFLLTQFLQSVLGYTPLEAGIRLLPMAGVMMVISPLSAKVVERIGSKVVVATGLSVAGIGLVIASRLTAGASYPEVLSALLVLAAGMALVMPPATESIMGSLPPAKAGVGSAVNDTTRQVGGALGVAVLGSVMSSTYGPRVTDAISGFPVPADQATAISDQIGAAIRAASEIGGEPGRMLADVASRGFADGMSTAFIIGAAALALGAVIVALFLPARAHDHEELAVSGDGNGADAAPVSGDTIGREPTESVTRTSYAWSPANRPGPR